MLIKEKGLILLKDTIVKKMMFTLIVKVTV